jgi:hypothetical protein
MARLPPKQDQFDGKYIAKFVCHRFDLLSLRVMAVKSRLTMH